METRGLSSVPRSGRFNSGYRRFWHSAPGKIRSAFYPSSYTKTGMIAFGRDGMNHRTALPLDHGNGHSRVRFRRHPANLGAALAGDSHVVLQSGPRTHVGPLSRHGIPEADHMIGCSISRPRTPRYQPWAGHPWRIPFQAARPEWTTNFPWFLFTFCPRRRPIKDR